jgi:hypothetical protein
MNVKPVGHHADSGRGVGQSCLRLQSVGHLHRRRHFQRHRRAGRRRQRLFGQPVWFRAELEWLPVQPGRGWRADAVANAPAKPLRCRRPIHRTVAVGSRRQCQSAQPGFSGQLHRRKFRHGDAKHQRLDGAQNYAGESVAISTAYTDTSGGTENTAAPANLYGYVLGLNDSKTVQSVTLPSNSDVMSWP